VFSPCGHYLACSLTRSVTDMFLRNTQSFVKTIFIETEIYNVWLLDEICYSLKCTNV
jgi:hypothetical protein